MSNPGGTGFFKLRKTPSPFAHNLGKEANIVELRKGEKVINRGPVHYSGTNWILGAFIGGGWGILRLTNQRLLLDYFILGEPSTNMKYGIFRNRIVIPLTEITNVQKLFFRWSTFVKVNYNHEGKSKIIYFEPWTVLGGLNIVNRIKIAGEWMRQIRKVANLDVKKAEK